ncbi:hypothetical protein [Apibacter adventoris]|uniref:hypothetical protein n=1 Tax=Apibacter adventoris TaxID=1679466 RepID=UPI000CF71F6E|nr:hypothetical protein [Apibacter adventoris]PQL95838.1 hypothetical protein C4S76_01365 [Apibacter adventoris]
MKLIKYFFFLLILTFNCTNKAQENKMDAKNIMEKIVIKNKIYKQPIYGIHIQSASPYEVSINDILLDSFYDSGSVDYDLDLNQWLLKSGTITIKSKIYPTRDKPKANLVEENIASYFQISLYVYEKDDGQVSKNNLKTYKFSSFTIPVPYLEEEWKMDIKLPYKLTGWDDGVNLIEEDRGKLAQEVIAKYEELFKILNSGDPYNYLKMFKKADQEYYLSNYYTKFEIEEEDKSNSQRVLDSQGKVLFKKDYILKFFANGKLVTLESMEGDSPIFSEQELDNEYFNMMLYRPTLGKPLEVIR